MIWEVEERQIKYNNDREVVSAWLSIVEDDLASGN
jgi:hypothetical protein